MSFFARQNSLRKSASQHPPIFPPYLGSFPKSNPYKDPNLSGQPVGATISYHAEAVRYYSRLACSVSDLTNRILRQIMGGFHDLGNSDECASRVFLNSTSNMYELAFDGRFSTALSGVSQLVFPRALEVDPTDNSDQGGAVLMNPRELIASIANRVQNQPEGCALGTASIVNVDFSTVAFVLENPVRSDVKLWLEITAFDEQNHCIQVMVKAELIVPQKFGNQVFLEDLMSNATSQDKKSYVSELFDSFVSSAQEIESLIESMSILRDRKALYERFPDPPNHGGSDPAPENEDREALHEIGSAVESASDAVYAAEQRVQELGDLLTQCLSQHRNLGGWYNEDKVTLQIPLERWLPSLRVR